MKQSLLLAALALGAGCSSPDTPPPAATKSAAPAPVKVRTAPVEVQQVPRYLTLTGSVLANRQADVAANVSGRVVSTHVERGQPVKQGEVLATVDPQASALSATAAAAQSRAAESQKSLAQAECDRADSLYAQEVMPRADYDRVKTQCTAQLHQASAAEANARLARKLAGDTVIRAPFDGVVSERYVSVGEFVQQPSRVASVVTVDPVRVQVSVPETAVSLLKEGQRLQLQVAAWPERTFPATVRYLSPTLRPSTRDLVVEALAPNADGALRPGMFGSVLLQVGEEELPTVPAEAVRTEGSVSRLFLVKDGRLEERVVSTGVRREGRVALLEPLEAGTPVVLAPAAQLRDGAPVVAEASHAVAR